MLEQKKKILFIVEAMGGGVFTYIVDLSNELTETFNVYVVYAARKQTPTDYKDYFDKRIHLIEVKHFKRAINPKNDVKAFFEIKQIAKQVQPDLVHLHSSKAGVLGRFAFDGNKIPLFYTPHGYSFLMENHSCTKRFIYKSIEKLCGKRNCTTSVNNGINVLKLQKLLDSIGESVSHKFTIFTLGRICYQKNPILFNQIAQMLPNINFLWIGDGGLGWWRVKHKLTIFVSLISIVHSTLLIQTTYEKAVV